MIFLDAKIWGQHVSVSILPTAQLLKSEDSVTFYEDTEMHDGVADGGVGPPRVGHQLQPGHVVRAPH